MNAREKKRGAARERRESEKLLRFIDRAAKEVERWPAWMKGKPDPERNAKP